MANVDELKDPELFRTLFLRVSGYRRGKVERIKHEDGRRLSLGAGVVLEAALKEWLSMDYHVNSLSFSSSAVHRSPEKTLESDGHRGPERALESACRYVDPFLSDLYMDNFRIAEGKYGKPYLPDYPDIFFSLSHSGDKVMCAIGRSPVGCDVEKVGSERVIKAARFFTLGEQKLVNGSAENFFRIWTLKESFMKMTGLGFKMRLDSFEITLSPLEIKQNIYSLPVALKEYALRDGYCYSCSCLGEIAPESMTIVNLSGETDMY